MKPLALGLVVGLVVASAGAQAADQQNRFAPKGAGAATCARYLEERKGLTRTYAEFGGWIDGFVSAYNLLRNDTLRHPDLGRHHRLGAPAGQLLLRPARRPLRQRPGHPA